MSINSSLPNSSLPNLTTAAATSNSTGYDLVCSSQFEHYLLLVVVMFVCVFGVLGNTLVTIATMYRKAFSGDNISIVFVRNLAIADLSYIVLQVIPDISVRLSGHRWVLGAPLCFVSAHAVYIPGAANISFIFSISLYRLLSCMFPFRFRETITIRQANIFSVVVWVWSAFPSLAYLAHETTAVFQPLTSDCDVEFDRKGLVNLIVAGPYVLIPFFGLIVCNVTLFCIASKSAARMGRSARQASITIGAVSGLFVVSWLPYIARKIIIVFTGSELNWPLRPDILFYELSIFGNPIIYTIVNDRFKIFLKNKFLKIIKQDHRTIPYNSNSVQSEVMRNKAIVQMGPKRDCEVAALKCSSDEKHLVQMGAKRDCDVAALK